MITLKVDEDTAIEFVDCSGVGGHGMRVGVE